MSATKTNKGWKIFNFGETETLPKNNVKEVVRPKHIIKKRFNDFDFEQQVHPENVEDLAVHSRKISDIETWLSNNVLLKSRNIQNSSILLVTGPTGCGKTATVKVLCRKLGIEISEWINPVDRDKDFLIGQTSQLLEFLSVSKYSSLFCIDKPKIILIEDFPNSVIHNPSDFIHVLNKCRDSKNSVLFICSEANNLNLNLIHTLFPEETRQLYSIHTISFNAASNTMLKKALNRAQQLIKEHSDLVLPEEIQIDNIISSSMGDIRCAINQLYFICSKGNSTLPSSPSLKPNKKRKRKIKTELRNEDMIKNERLSFFHSLGRVLNPKRDEINGSWRLKCNIEALVDEISIQPTTFNAFVHANYIKYFGDVNDVSNAADILSLSQKFLNKWDNRTDVLQYGLWVPIMGLMVHNEHKVSKWNQITAPRKTNKVIKNDLNLRSLNVVDRCYYDIISKCDYFKNETKLYP